MSEQAAAVETAATPTATPTATPSPTPAAPEQTAALTLSWADIQKLQAEAGELRGLKAAAEQKAREAEERAIAKDVENQNVKGLMEKLAAKEKAESERLERDYQSRLKSEQDRSAAELTRIAAERAAAENARQATESRAKRYALDGELARALSGQDLVPNAAEDLMSLWKGRFTVEPHGESFAVKADDGRTVSEFVAAQLGSDRYKHFVKAGSRSGGTALSGVNTTQSPAPTQTAPPTATPEPKNMGEAIILQIQAQQKETGDARTNMNLGFGLKASAR